MGALVFVVTPPARQNYAMTVMTTPSSPTLNTHYGHYLLPFHHANTVIHPTTRKEATIKYLIAGNVPDQYGPQWSLSKCKEFRRLAQGYKQHVKGTNTIFFIPRSSVPTNRVAAHIRMVADIRPHKPDPLRVRITVGGGNIELDYNVGTPTAYLSTAKILINSTLSTPRVKWCGLDFVNMYSNTDLTTNEYL